MNELIQIDFQLFEFIHLGIKNVFFDLLMPILREKLVWIPFYVFIILFAFMNMSVKNASVLLSGLIISVIISDVTSSQIIKKNVMRPRPCHEIKIDQHVVPLVTCGSGYSFPSSHASNHFAIAFFLIFSRRLEKSWVKNALIFWASIISLAQIYVGVHYPLDIIAGIIVGYFCARIISFAIFRN